MVDYAIFRTAKLNHNGNIMGSLAHTFRERETFNADPQRTPDNKILIGSDSAGGVFNTLNNRLSQLGKIRKNGVRCVELLQTYSPEAKVPIKDWVKANIKWNKETFGEENVISSVLHDDETTPHIVTYIVPEVDGKLNCREILGGRAKLRKLQTSYAKAMEEFGLQRGKENSKAIHTTLQDYYGAINKVDKKVKKLNRRQAAILKSVPDPKTLETKSGYSKRVHDILKPNYDSYSNLTKTLAKKDLTISNLQKKLKEQQEEIEMYKSHADFYQELYKSLTDEDKLNKDEVTLLRKLDISMVAKKLKYLGKVNNKENAIDLTMRINNFTYQQSIAWLYHEFGPEYVAGAVAEHVNVSKPKRPFRPVEQAIKRNVVKQLDGLGCNKYRLTIQRDDNTYLPGKYYDLKSKETKEKFYTKEDLVNMIPYLLQRNTQENYNISITPMDDHCFYILLDDCRLKYSELKEKGYTPCLYQKTSYNSYQAVFKVPNELNRDAVLKLCKELNVKYGDKDMNGLRHPFRLAGFENRKPKHNRNNTYPVVELENSINEFCEHCIKLVEIIISKFFGVEQNVYNNDENSPGM